MTFRSEVPMRITDMKYCSRRKHHLPRTEFGSNINNTDGLQTYCRTCAREYREERRARKLAEYERRNSWSAA